MIDLRILGVSNPIFLIQSVCPSVMLSVSDSEMGWTEEFWSKTNSLKWQNLKIRIFLYFLAAKTNI